MFSGKTLFLGNTLWGGGDAVIEIKRFRLHGILKLHNQSIASRGYKLIS